METCVQGFPVLMSSAAAQILLLLIFGIFGGPIWRSPYRPRWNSLVFDRSPLRRGRVRCRVTRCEAMVFRPRLVFTNTSDATLQLELAPGRVQSLEAHKWLS